MFHITHYFNFQLAYPTRVWNSNWLELLFKVYRTDIDQLTIHLGWGGCPNDHTLLCISPSRPSI